jgi:hypothetical protein
VKKRLTVLFALVFAVAFLASYLGRSADAAPTTCYYKCICSVPHKCCKTNGVESCKPVPDAPIACTQSYPC